MQLQEQQYPPLKLLLTVEEAAQALNLGRTRMYALLQRRSVASVKIGRTRLVPVSALHVFIEQQLIEQQ